MLGNEGVNGGRLRTLEYCQPSQLLRGIALTCL